ncbi:DeoR/GlpR family DNA-binding transcription regulator [Oceanobacillus kapialis]|uniref:DeoR/GlpR family DNA-binding transcription regulator n=1 Tax=Oceanobacillus kapialis TaxID=481353 RepID=UPI00384FD85F
MKMFVSERRSIIMKLLKEKRRITVKELASEIGVSEATLRIDLNYLEQDNLLTRTHGGAVLNDYREEDTSFSVRSKRNIDEKMKIAEMAFETIEHKQCILLDGSSTVLELARYIKKQSLKLTVVTSGIQTALELKENPNITVILIGGVATQGSSAIEGTLGIDVLDNVNIDTMYTSANGLSISNGLSDFNLYEVFLKNEMIKRANKVVALIDSSKIGATSSAVFAKVNEVDTLITDQPLNEDFTVELEQKGVKIVLTD